jgi:glutamate-1-semialdehyde aminotransferase/predicted aldo/keto reductase-like oxidoreductase
METRRVGRSDLRLSVVGLGTAQLQMVPERQAVETLVRGFELGVNWVHTAPDYGGIDPWIQRAIEVSRHEVMVLSSGPPHARDLPAFFENTCHVYKTKRLAMYGLAGIEDIEWHGENVWGPGGMVEYLRERKAEGRLGGIYCSTHASADYVARLVESGAFDAIMLSWNPLGFHVQSHAWARAAVGRDYEDLAEHRERIFPLAAERGVSLLVMKPFAGGLLCRGKALPPHDWFADGAEPIPAPDVLRLILEEPAVCAVVPGSTSVEEAEENARAGHAPIAVTPESRAAIARAVTSMRTSLCSRCGRCDTTCSRSLPIPAMFRDAYIWTTRNETNQANPAENYFDLHPATMLTCVTCTEQTCACPQGIDIPVALGRVHARMQELHAAHQHPGPSSGFRERIVDGRHRVLVQTADVPAHVTGRAQAVARFQLQNVGEDRWLASQHTPERADWTGIGVVVDDRLSTVVPLRNTVCPGEVSPMAFEFQVPAEPGPHAMGFRLMPLHGRRQDEGTLFHSITLTVDAGTTGRSGKALSRRIVRFARRSLARLRRGGASAGLAPGATDPAYGVRYLEHSFPARMKAGVTYGVRLSLRNTGSLTWPAHPPDGRRVEVQLFVDDALLAVLPLPHGDVAPGRSVTLHVPVRAHDDEGPHRVRVELVHQAVTSFADRGVEPWRIDVHVVAAPMSESVRLLEISRKHNPWYYNPLSGIPESRDGHPFPLFISRAKGCRAWDAEGNEFIDYTMGWGSTILGHADDRIQDAIRQALDHGTLLPFPHPVEMDVTRMLIEAFPGNDMVAFGKNGSDVCTIASRLARVVTGKRTILSCGFHGWQDFALDYFRFEDCGIPDRPERCLHKFTCDDRGGFLDLYERHKGDLAAVMIEPAGPLVSDEAGLGGPADVEFLRLLEDSAHRAGALLIFDEIVTAFRYPKGSVQAATGIVPDLTCVGKALASGMPLSALIGPYRHFLPHFHKTHFCPTFKGEVLSLAAARAALRIYRSEPVVEHLWRYGEALREGIHHACRQTGVRGDCTGPPFRMAFVFREPDPVRRQLKRTLLMQELLKERVITVNGMMLPSYAHDDQALRQTLAAFGTALEVVAHADRRDELHRRVELALL